MSTSIPIDEAQLLVHDPQGTEPDADEPTEDEA